MSAPSLVTRRWSPGDETAFTPRADFARQAEIQPWDWSKGPPGWWTWSLFASPECLICLGVAGLIDAGPYRVRLWARLAELRRREWFQALALTNEVLLQFHGCNPRHVIAADAATPAAQRCLEHLGFAFAGDGFELDGEDYRELVKAA